MSVPSFLDTEYGYLELKGITDVQDIMDAMDSTIKALSTPWTEPSADTFRSPPNAVGQYVEFTFTRNNATELDFDPYDHTGLSMFGGVTRTMRIMDDPDANSDQIQIFYGPDYLWIETANPGTTFGLGEHVGVGQVDMTPENQDTVIHTGWARARRNAAGTADTSGDAFSDMWRFSHNSGVFGAIEPIRGPVDIANNVAYLRRESNAFVIVPIDTVQFDSAGLRRYSGRMYQALMCISDIEPWTEIQVPIDDSPLTLGTFKISNCGVRQNCRICFRIA